MRYCPECGTGHDCTVTAGEGVESDEVKIARINADSAEALAKIAARQDRDWNQTRTEVAEIEADAMVEAAEVEGEVIAAAIEGSDLPAPDPVEIIAPELVNTTEVDNEDAPPELEGSPVPPPEKKTGLGMW